MSTAVNEVGFLFDLDGVLIDSERQYSLIWARINKEYPTGVENLETVIKGTTLSKILSDYFPDESIREKVKQLLHRLEMEMHYDYLPSAEEFLCELKKRKIPAALVTSSDEKKMNHLKEELPDILDYFDFVVTGDMVSSSKPSPEGYLLAASKINKKPKNCVVFEDSLQGVTAGRNAGAYVVGIAGTLPAQHLKPFSDIIVDTLAELDLDNLIHILNNR